VIDINKKYHTRDGRAVRIYAVDGGPLQILIHGAVLDKGGWSITSWGSDGEWSKDHKDWDLIEDRPRHKRTVWLHVFKNSTVCATEEAHYEITNRLACIKVELDFEEGEGL